MLSYFRTHPLAWIMTLAVLLRAAAMARGPHRFDDPDNYLPLARSLADGKGFRFRDRPTAYRPPLYPVLLVPAVALGGYRDAGIAVLHLALGAGTVAMTAAAGLGFGLSKRRAMAAALVAACDPVLLWQARSVMTETPAAFLLASTLAGLSVGGCRGAFLGGLGFGLSGLCRPSLLAPAVLAVAAALIARPGCWRERALRASVLAATVVLVLAPWMIRNRVALGAPIWTTTHGGYTLALANNPVYYAEVLNGPPGRVWTGDDQWRWWDSVTRQTAGMTERQADRYLQATVWRLARERPVDFLRASMARLGRFWGVAPSASVYPGLTRYATLAWTLPLWIALLLGLLRRPTWNWPMIAAPSILLGLTLVHTLFWTDMRMRAPIVPAIALIAAAAAWRPPQPPASGQD